MRREVLPLPEGPHMASFSPEAMDRVRLVRMGGLSGLWIG